MSQIARTTSHGMILVAVSTTSTAFGAHPMTACTKAAENDHHDNKQSFIVQAKSNISEIGNKIQ